MKLEEALKISEVERALDGKLTLGAFYKHSVVDEFGVKWKIVAEMNEHSSVTFGYTYPGHIPDKFNNPKTLRQDFRRAGLCEDIRYFEHFAKLDEWEPLE